MALGSGKVVHIPNYVQNVELHNIQKTTDINNFTG
jgi:hypothetical protein